MPILPVSSSHARNFIEYLPGGSVSPASYSIVPWQAALLWHQSTLYPRDPASHYSLAPSAKVRRRLLLGMREIRLAPGASRKAAQYMMKAHNFFSAGALRKALLQQRNRVK
jgi:hypothetical protein